jgi:RNA-binding protein
MSTEKKTIDNQQLKQFRTIAHQLRPILTVAGDGVTENIIKELNQALERHELIKIKIQLGDREVRQQVIDELCLQSKATCVQRIGNVAVLYRPAKEPNPKLSNLIRHQ